MKRTLFLLALLLTLPLMGQNERQTIRSGELWPDNTGAHINAHGHFQHSAFAAFNLLCCRDVDGGQVIGGELFVGGQSQTCQKSIFVERERDSFFDEIVLFLRKDETNGIVFLFQIDFVEVCRVELDALTCYTTRC